MVKELKEVALEDLLGRNKLSDTSSSKKHQGKNVLITGAGGSIGSEISRQVAKNDPKKIILLDSNEYALYLIKDEIEELESKIDIVSIIGSVINREQMRRSLLLIRCSDNLSFDSLQTRISCRGKSTSRQYQIIYTEQKFVLNQQMRQELEHVPNFYR